MRSPAFYRRNLPHWHPPGTSLFVTWRLYGSLPRRIWPGASHKKLSEGEKYAEVDRELDQAKYGPTWLKDRRIAECIVEALKRGALELKLFELCAFVVMSNHVHVLLTPHVPLARITRSLKRATAFKANELLSRAGQPFWQDESFDHWIRTPGEFQRVKRYIEWNPVKAGLAKRPEDWPWSSACRSTGL